MIDRDIIDEYVRVYFLREQTKLGLNRYMSNDEFVAELAAKIRYQLTRFPMFSRDDHKRVALSLFDKLRTFENFEIVEDSVAGNYVTVKEDIYSAFRGAYLKSNSVNTRADSLGERLFRDAFSRMDHLPPERIISSSPDLVPASDRVVRFDHNTVKKAESQTQEIIEEVGKKNEIEVQGIRELVLGLLSAGREMMLSGYVRLSVFQITFLDTLVWLAKRYEKEAIGALASALIAALLSALGLPS